MNKYKVDIEGLLREIKMFEATKPLIKALSIVSKKKFDLENIFLFIDNHHF